MARIAAGEDELVVGWGSRDGVAPPRAEYSDMEIGTERAKPVIVVPI